MPRIDPDDGERLIIVGLPFTLGKCPSLTISGANHVHVPATIPEPGNEPVRETGGATALSKRIARWRRSLLGKLTLLFLAGVMFAYVIGALVGWSMFVDAAKEQWNTQARINTQIASATLRGIYTYVAVNADESGQVNGIVTSLPVGDDDSVLATGYNPVDVLALISAQTKNDTWLFQYDETAGVFVTMATSAQDQEAGASPLPPEDETLFGVEGKQGRFATGFATIGGQEHYLGLLPIVSPQGKVLGALAVSIGSAEELYRAQGKLIRNSLIMLLVVLMLTSVAVTSLVKRLFRPVPVLVQATLRIADEQTDIATPFQDRKDELGDMAVAIETLREAVVERGRLRQIRDMAVQMEHMAHHDALTGLPNRALLMKSLDEVLADTSQDAFNVMMLDLDRFKAVNDTLGHACGDALLVQTAQRVSSVLGPGDIAARLGGDEFAVIQRVARDAELEARKLASRILETIAAGFTLDGHEVIVGTSIGISCSPRHGASATQLLQGADLALYRAKAAGRGTFIVYEEGMDMIAQDQHALQIDLGLALQREEFQVHYQPIINLADNAVCGFEALVRWRHPQHGFIPPDRFIPLAEETGIIAPLGEWVLNRACRDAVSWPEHLKLAVNLSAVQLRLPEIAKTVAEVLQLSGLRASRLELEITETALLAGPASNTALNALHDMGISIVLDDFGTGYASLHYLANISFSKVKIDREFVADLATRPACRAIVGAIIGLARQLDMDVTAEGVETEEQLVLLRAAGCGTAQGYHFARPRPLEDISYEIEAPAAPRRVGLA
jgi:diguanylate cyclase (GGDEF)-like protein